MKIESGNYCPLLKKECIGLQCAWITQIRGMNPNTGEEVDEWKCAVSWLPFLVIENSQQQRGTSTAVESFRNEVVKGNQENQQLYINSLQQGVIPAQISQINPIMNILESTDDK